MGTRADFYVGRGASAEWLGSIAWDGYPEGIAPRLLRADTERKYRNAVAAFFAKRQDVSTPATGWPWPWENSQTTDYAYAFDNSRVWGSCFGNTWFNASKPPENQREGRKVAFPGMKTDRVVLSGQRSGLIVVTPHGVL